MALSNMTRIESLLEDPASDISLGELKDELNELAKLRNNSRLSFCKRLALAYMLVVGNRPSGKQGEMRSFTRWCEKNLKSASDKRYSSGTIRAYLNVGFSTNPEKKMRDLARTAKRRDERMRKLGNGLARAISNGTKVVPIRRQRVDGDIGQAVNKLMSAWESATPIARSQFIYMVTGAKIAV